jgi:hypothetical protein
MKIIAATVAAKGQRDFFWPGGGFNMFASSSDGIGFNLNFGGIFTSVPAAVAVLTQRELVSSPGSKSMIEEAKAGGTLKESAGGALVNPGAVHLTKRIDLFGLGLDYAMYHKRVGEV